MWSNIFKGLGAVALSYVAIRIEQQTDHEVEKVLQEYAAFERNNGGGIHG
jgi:hypothetical protein